MAVKKPARPRRRIRMLAARVPAPPLTYGAVTPCRPRQVSPTSFGGKARRRIQWPHPSPLRTAILSASHGAPPSGPHRSHRPRPITQHIHRQVQRAPNPDSLIQRVQIDHRRRHIAMPEQLLHRPNVIAISQQLCCERVPQGVRSDALRQTRTARRVGHRPLNRRIEHMVPTTLAGRTIHVLATCRKHPGPRQSRFAFGLLRSNAPGKTT